MINGMASTRINPNTIYAKTSAEGKSTCHIRLEVRDHVVSDRKAVPGVEIYAINAISSRVLKVYFLDGIFFDDCICTRCRNRTKVKRPDGLSQIRLHVLNGIARNLCSSKPLQGNARSINTGGAARSSRANNIIRYRQCIHN